MKDALSVLDEQGRRDKILECKPNMKLSRGPSLTFSPPNIIFPVILGLQRPDGAFQGDKWGEIDSRFLYCSVSALAHLGALDRLDREKTVAYVLQCHNFHGGFGTNPGAESHSGQGEPDTSLSSSKNDADLSFPSSFCMRSSAFHPRLSRQDRQRQGWVVAL